MRPMLVPADLCSRVARIARRAKVKQAEVYRMAIRCGLAEAENRLVADSDRLFPNMDPLPRGCSTGSTAVNAPDSGRKWRPLPLAPKP